MPSANPANEGLHVAEALSAFIPGPWHAPRTWVTGDVITATDANNLWRDDLLILKTSISDDGKAWAGALKGYTETLQSLSLAAGVLTIDYTLGNHVEFTMSANMTAITVNNVPATDIRPIVLYVDANGSGFTQTWSVNGSSVKWPAGTAPTLTTTNGKQDKIVLTKIGSSWYGEVARQNS